MVSNGRWSPWPTGTGDADTPKYLPEAEKRMKPFLVKEHLVVEPEKAP